MENLQWHKPRRKEADTKAIDWEFHFFDAQDKVKLINRKQISGFQGLEEGKTAWKGQLIKVF